MTGESKCGFGVFGYTDHSIPRSDRLSMSLVHSFIVPARIDFSFTFAGCQPGLDVVAAFGRSVFFVFRFFVVMSVCSVGSSGPAERPPGEGRPSGAAATVSLIFDMVLVLPFIEENGASRPMFFPNQVL